MECLTVVRFRRPEQRNLALRLKPVSKVTLLHLLRPSLPMLSLSIYPNDTSSRHRPTLLGDHRKRRAATVSDTEARLNPSQRAPMRSSASRPKHVSFSSPLFFEEEQEQEPYNSAIDSTSSQIGIRLAKQDMLLPMLDRNKEVHELLFETQQNAHLVSRLQATFSNRYHLGYLQKFLSAEEDDWSLLCRLLTGTSRSTIDDQSWLHLLHKVVFNKSPPLWCQFAECLGVQDVPFDNGRIFLNNKDDGLTHNNLLLAQASLHTKKDQGDEHPSSFNVEVLYDGSPSMDRWPNSLKDFYETRSDSRRHGSADSRTGTRSRGESNSIYEEPENIVNDLFENHGNAFDGLRLSLTSSLELPSHHVSKDTSGKEEKLSSEQEKVKFHKHRRLSSLFLPKNEEMVTNTNKFRLSSRPKSFTFGGHADQRSLMTSTSRHDDSLSKNTLSTPWTKISERRQNQVSPRDNTPGRQRSFSNLETKAAKQERRALDLQRMSMSTYSEDSGSGSERASDASNISSHRYSGLLPDGRTRHPSSGSWDADNEAREAFRRGIQGLSSSTDSELPGAVLSPSSNSTAAPLTPLDTSPSVGIVQFAEHPRGKVNPVDVSRGVMTKSSRLLETQEHDASKNAPQLDDISSMAKNAESPLITGAGGMSPEKSDLEIDVGRPRETKKRSRGSSLIFPIPPNPHFSRSRELNVRLQEAADSQLPSWEFVSHTIGFEGISQIKKVIQEAGEREKMDDEALLEQVARKCFDLVKMDLTDAEKSQGHSPLQPYYDDIDGYEARWAAFEVLLRSIWLVDEVVLRKVHSICGPAEHLRIQSSG